jgi:hypothetical protein
MPTFAPAYRPTKAQQAFLTHEQKREAKKRKRDDEDDDDKSDASSSAQSSDSDDAKPYFSASAPSIVKKTDPYHVAGLSREHPLPRYPFPHAPVKSSDAPQKSPHEELASLNPPLYVPKPENEDHATSLKRKHLGNVTAILHRCMLNGDWERASRAWGLLARTEINGLGIDVRHHGRWGIGAEILIRREQAKIPEVSATSARRNSDNDTSLVHENDDTASTNSKFADEGFKLAREYYERLVLQYPHTPHTQHTVNAKVFYPALFNIWVYEVQARYKHLRAECSKARRSSTYSMASDDDSELNGSQQALVGRELLAREIADTTAIADRLDQLLLSPPYDISEPLLKIRGMIGLWLSDLYKSLANTTSRPSGEFSSSPPGIRGEYADRVSVAHNRQKASKERRRARELLAKVAGRDASANTALRAADAEDMSE